MAERVIATETVVVHDDTLNIDRRVVEGLPVPRDLVDAYEGRDYRRVTVRVQTSDGRTVDAFAYVPGTPGQKRA